MGQLAPSVLLEDTQRAETGMRVTGIEASLMRLTALEKKLEQYQTVVTGLPLQVAQVFRQQFVVNGVAAVTQSDLQMFGAALEAKIDAALTAFSLRGQEGRAVPAGPAQNQVQGQLRQYKTFRWQHEVASYRFVPGNFTYPVVPCHAMWNL